MKIVLTSIDGLKQTCYKNRFIIKKIYIFYRPYFLNEKFFKMKKETDSDKTVRTGHFVYSGTNKKYSYKLDFEIGHLVKSPCQGCEDRNVFPKCIKDCDIIDKIQTKLSESMSCAR